jgi:hypothetical protein
MQGGYSSLMKTTFLLIAALISSLGIASPYGLTTFASLKSVVQNQAETSQGIFTWSMCSTYIKGHSTYYDPATLARLQDEVEAHVATWKVSGYSNVNSSHATVTGNELGWNDTEMTIVFPDALSLNVAACILQLATFQGDVPANTGNEIENFKMGIFLKSFSTG